MSIHNETPTKKKKKKQKKTKGLAVATRRSDAELDRKRRHRPEETSDQAVEDGIGHAPRTGDDGDEDAVEDAADPRARAADRHEEGPAAASSSTTATATSTAEQRDGRPAQAIVGHHAEGYSGREGGRYTHSHTRTHTAYDTSQRYRSRQVIIANDRRSIARFLSNFGEKVTARHAPSDLISPRSH